MRAPFSNRVRLHEMTAPVATSDARCSRTSFSARPVSCAISRSSRWPYLRKQSNTARASVSRRCSSSPVQASVSRRSPVTSYLRVRLSEIRATHQNRMEAYVPRSIDRACCHVLIPKERNEGGESPRWEDDQVRAGTKSIRGTLDTRATTALLGDRSSTLWGQATGIARECRPGGSPSRIKPATALALGRLGQFLDGILDRFFDQLPFAR